MNFRNWSIAEVEAHNARVSRKPSVTQEPQPSRGEELEATLADQIIDECDRRGWLWFRSRPDARTGRRIGEFDFIIYADRGRIFNIECKAKGKKQTAEQLGIQTWARKLGHQADCVWTFGQFLEIIK